EFAIGTNKGIQRFTGETLVDEKIGGTIHMARGQSIEDAGGVNKSQIHWDIVHSMRDGGEIWVDGELVYRSGDFVVEACAARSDPLSCKGRMTLCTRTLPE